MSAPRIVDKTNVIPIPANPVKIARHKRVRSPRVVASANAILGPSIGAITIAPMINVFHRSLNALAMTETELSYLAAAAIVGHNSSPVIGYNTPVAIL